MTENSAMRSSGSELLMASNVAPLTSRGRLRWSPIAEETFANDFAAR